MNKFRALMVLFTLISTQVVPQSINNETLIGVWEATSVERKSCNSSEDGGVVVLECPEICMRITLYADGKAENSYSDPSSSEEKTMGTYQVKGDQIVWCDPLSDDPCETALFVQTEDTLIFTTKEEDNGCEVITTFARK